MNVKSVELLEGKLRIIGEDKEFFLKDGVYRQEDGEAITVQNGQIVNVFTMPDLKVASINQLKSFLADLEEQLTSTGMDAQLANIDLQNMLQKQQQTLQTMSNVSKMLHDTAMAIIRKIG